jgi:hypothetical protein
MQIPKSNLKLTWKEHSVDLAAFSAWVKSVEPSCCGTSADYQLTVWFMEELSEESKQAIEAKWAELDDAEHEMVKSYRSREQLEQAKKTREEAIKAKKLKMISKTWANMSQVERKLVMGLDDEVTDEELDI